MLKSVTYVPEHVLPMSPAFSIFGPIHNHLAESPTCDWGEGFGTLFETYGEEFAFVTEQDPALIWTWIDGDDGQYVVSGMQWVNRVGYFVCSLPVREGLTIEIKLEDGEEAP